MRVLIVDDHAQNIRLFTRMLKKEGYECIGVESAEVALTTIDDSFNVAVIDVSLPFGMSGIQLAQELRKRFPDILLIGISGDNHSSCEHFDDFLQKPFTVEKFRSVIR